MQEIKFFQKWKHNEDEMAILHGKKTIGTIKRNNQNKFVLWALDKNYFLDQDDLHQVTNKLIELNNDV